MARDPNKTYPEDGPTEEEKARLGGDAESEEEGLTRSEVINEFDQDTGKALIDAGLSTISAIQRATDEEILSIHGIGPATLADLREKAPYIEPEAEVEEDDGPVIDDEELDLDVPDDEPDFSHHEPTMKSDVDALKDFGIPEPPGGTLEDVKLIEGVDYVDAETEEGYFRCYLNVPEDEFEWIEAKPQGGQEPPQPPASARVQRIRDSQK